MRTGEYFFQTLLINCKINAFEWWKSWSNVDDFLYSFQGTSEKILPFIFYFSLSGVIVWAWSELHTISQGGIIVALAASPHWHILTYKFPPVKLVTLPWPWFIDFFFIFLLLLKEEWDVRPVLRISQMRWREVAVTQQASPLNLLWVTCLAYDLYTMTFTHFSVRIHWRRMPTNHTKVCDSRAV